MSYDFMLARRRGEEALDEELTYDSFGRPTTPLNPAKEQLKDKIATALLAFDPELKRFNKDFKAIADFEKITEDQARVMFRTIELNHDTAENTGIQITLYDDFVCVSVPFWHSGPKAEQVFRRIWKYMEVIASTTEYVPRDSQIEPAELNLNTDFQRSLRSYTGGVQYTRGAVWKILLKHGWRLLFSRRSK
jgi:hypothetical protein